MAETQSTAQKTSLPFVSVIMPVRNEGKYIERSLNAVLAQDYPADHLEVIVADGLSEDDTRTVFARLAAGRPNMTLIDNPNRIVATGLNRAVRIAKGEVIVRVDGHCEIAPDYVSNCVNHLLTSDVAGVGGPMETIGETPIAQTIALAMSSNFGVGGSAFRTTRDRDMFVTTVPFPAYWRKEIIAAGPFDEELVRNQDDEYNYRLVASGKKILLAADVKSRYYSRSSLHSLWRQYYQYGYYKVRVMQKHPRQMHLHHFMPALLVAGLVFSIPLALFFTIGRILLAIVLGSYLLSNLGVAIYTAMKYDRRSLTLLPLVYAILHLSYGSGFWIGLIRFAGLWRQGKPSLQTADNPDQR